MDKSSSKLLASAAFIATALAAWPAGIRAEGALAVGVPPNVSESGIAIGVASNYATPEEASQQALAHCQAYDTGGPSIASLCMQVGKTFHDQCVAVALDQKAGTPGYGWAIAPSKEVAQEQALANCEATDGPDRRGSCVITDTKCDGKAGEDS